MALDHLGARPRIWIGTDKGAYGYVRADGGWHLVGPALDGWRVDSLVRLGDGRLVAGTSHYAFGATIRVSDDGGETWTQAAKTPVFAEQPVDERPFWERSQPLPNPEGPTRSLTAIWNVVEGGPAQPGRLYAGVADAALFSSDDRGDTWHEVAGLQRHHTRALWTPGNGGLCLHAIVCHPTDPSRMWVAMSAVGVFETTDGGTTWTVRNVGLDAVPTGLPETEVGKCVHGIAPDPRDPETFYMQYHGGVLKSTDGAASWHSVEEGLPSNFGFPVATTRSGDVLVVPISTDARRFADDTVRVYRSRDGAATWERVSNGFPTTRQSGSVLRNAFASDHATGDVVFGTTNGEIYASGDEGASWERLPGTLTRVLGVTLA